MSPLANLRQVVALPRRRPKARRLPRAPSLRNIEHQYRARLLAVLTDAKKLVDSMLLPALGAIEQRVPGVRRDQDWTEETGRIFGNMRERFAQIAALRGRHREAKQTYKAAADETAREVAKANLDGLRGQLRTAFGVDVFVNDTHLQTRLGAFAKDNVDLIVTIPERYFSEVEQIVTRNFRAGRRAEQFRDQIEDRFGVSQSRAALIARDQVNKLNGELTEQRQTSLGLKEYIWRNSQDERVRGNPDGKYPNADPSHWSREGKVFSWDDPPEDGHPGFAILCRCTAEPVLPEELA